MFSLVSIILWILVLVLSVLLVIMFAFCVKLKQHPATFAFIPVGIYIVLCIVALFCSESDNSLWANIAIAGFVIIVAVFVGRAPGNERSIFFESLSICILSLLSLIIAGLSGYFPNISIAGAICSVATFAYAVGIFLVEFDKWKKAKACSKSEGVGSICLDGSDQLSDCDSDDKDMRIDADPHDNERSNQRNSIAD